MRVAVLGRCRVAYRNEQQMLVPISYTVHRNRGMVPTWLCDIRQRAIWREVKKLCRHSGDSISIQFHDLYVIVTRSFQQSKPPEPRITTPAVTTGSQV